jgi:hypothetical protein
VTLEIYSDTVPGDYFVQACANSVTPKIPETNTTNNCFQTTAKITVRNGPDLAVTAITNPPLPVVSQGQSFAATYTVTNTGEKARSRRWSSSTWCRPSARPGST